jgi:hypothetical protein
MPQPRPRFRQVFFVPLHLTSRWKLQPQDICHTVSLSAGPESSRTLDLPALDAPYDATSSASPADQLTALPMAAGITS